MLGPVSTRILHPTHHLTGVRYCRFFSKSILLYAGPAHKKQLLTIASHRSVPSIYSSYSQCDSSADVKHQITDAGEKFDMIY